MDEKRLRGSISSASSRELTRRERQVVSALCGGHSNKEIAYQLRNLNGNGSPLTVGTVKEYIHRIFSKTGHGSRLSLALWAKANPEAISDNSHVSG